MPRKTSLLKTGDVLKTNPRSGYWGCAVVLKTREATDRFRPMCLIGITQFVVRTDYEFADVPLSELSVIRFERKVRTAPSTYCTRLETCIGIYASKLNAYTVVIGRDPNLSLTNQPLTFDVGNGTNGRWPMYGPVSASLGSEAIHNWRREHDAKSFALELEKARTEHEEMLGRIAAGKKAPNS